MDRQKKHNDNSLEKYLKYFRNLFSGKEKHGFEKKIMQDKFEKEAFEGLSNLNSNEFSNDIAELQQKIYDRTLSRKSIFMPILRYTAAAILILSIGFTVYLVHQSTKNASKLAEKYPEKDTTLSKKFIVKSDSDSLKKNIAFIPAIRKEGEEIHKTEPPVDGSRYTARQPAIRREIEVKTTVQDESVRSMDLEPEVSIETIKNIPDNTTGANINKKQLIEIPESESVTAKSSRNMKTERTRTASPPGSQKNKNMVTGRVFSATDDAPLPGVTVLVKGTTTGTISDSKGNFQLAIPDEDSAVLQFAYVGYTTEELPVDDENDLTVMLNEDLIALDEVVVVGYGVQKKSDLTGAVTTIRSDEESVTPVIISPRPADGYPAYKQYIRENTDYEKLPAFEKPVSVKLSFTINVNGAVNHIVVDKSAGDAFDKEAIRLVKEGPAWQPGTEDGIPVSGEVTLKIKFEPEE